jgi:hypothetical protein
MDLTIRESGQDGIPIFNQIAELELIIMRVLDLFRTSLFRYFPVLVAAMVFFVCETSVSFAATRTWDGGGANTSWTTAANWVDDIAPVAGDDLVFPAAAAQMTASNNFFLFTSFNSITFTGGTYTIGGNPITLASGMTASAGTHLVNIIIRLSAPQTFLSDTGATLSVNIAVSNTGNLLTIDGSGTTVILGLITGSGGVTKEGLGISLLFSNNNYTGTTSVNNGVLIIDGSQQSSPVSVNGGALGGTGTTGLVTVTTGVISAGTLTSPTGVLSIHGNLMLDTTSAFVPKINGNTAGTGYDQLNVTGGVILGQCALLPAILPGYVPVVGDVYTVINNDGTDAVIGTFIGIPEGASITTPAGVNFRISYVGGSGNDVVITVTSARRAPFDFDGDGITDVGVFRPGNGTWYMLRSSDNGFVAQQFGLGTDRLAPGDFDGDGKTDVAVWRPATGYWYIITSGDGSLRATQFGANGDVPTAGDFDGDGKTDIAVYRPSVGTFYLLHSSDNSFHFQQWGANGDQPVIGNYDGDAMYDFGIYRPSTNTFYILLSSNGTVKASQFGQGGDKPIAGDFDGDGKTDIAIYRPSAGAWYYVQSSDDNFKGVTWGTSGDIPATGDYDADGKWDLAVFRPSAGIFYVLLSANGALKVDQFGANVDLPIASAYLP